MARLDARRLLPIAVSVLLFSPVAAADGVVVKSASIEHPVGSIVAEGEVLRLEAGQTVTVLDRSGVMIERRAGKYAAPSKREAASFIETAAALAAGPSARATIGGTRTGEDDPVSACNDQSSLKAKDSCIPRRAVVKQLRVASYTAARAGAPAQLVLESNFDGFAVCTGWNPSEDSRFLEGADPAHPILLRASSPASLAAPQTAETDNALPPSLSSVGCVGVSAEIWEGLRMSAKKALTPNSAAIVMSSFSRIRGDTIAEGRATAHTDPQL